MNGILREIIARRGLIYQLALKELKTRYCRVALGIIWAFLSPFLTAVIFYIIFSVFLKINTNETPFFLYLMTAVFTWGFFQESLLTATTSLMANRNLIRESNFPHYLIPLSIVLANLINFLPSLAIIIATAVLMLKGASVFLIALPLVILLHALITVGLSVFFSVVYVKFRDIKYILDALLLFLFYSTPVFYTLQAVKTTLPKGLFSIYMSNPFVGMLTLYRLAILKGFPYPTQEYASAAFIIFIPLLFGVVTCLFGFLLYEKNKNKINDYLSY
ncbi:MAG: ABC transporter permease [Candidatus Omnitrophica bacterium]|jgi:ABC-2 type transport system permease protein|nr:ABC transporter permease [Candidatus Omnitrophota bacterium]